MTTNTTRVQRILIIDDDHSVQVSLALLLKQAGFETRCCDGPAPAQAMLAAQAFDLVLQDMNFSPQTSGEEGLLLLAQIKQAHPTLPVLLMTAWGSIALAVRGVKAGAADFFTKPWQNQQLLGLIETTLELMQPAPGERLDRRALDQQFDFSGIVGEHPALLRALETVGRVARTRAAVLILGESGTGKELIADAIHRNSPRAARAMVKINMGAITPSLFESEMFGHVKGAFTDAKTERRGHVASAWQSTLFLDEIGELNRADQVKLLRVLQDQSFLPVGGSRAETADVRVVSATNQELAERVAEGAFREDLYYRLNLITIRLPALRERRSDIALIARQVMQQLAMDYGLAPVQISTAGLEWLRQQAWPGNIRQLRQTLERTVLLIAKPCLEPADFIAAQAHEEGAAAAVNSVDGLTLDQMERQLIRTALARYQGNLSQVARALGLSRGTLYRRLEKHALSTGGEDAK